VTAADHDPAAQRSALQAHLTKRGADETTTKSALARYDAMPPTVIPSPKVRAALAALTGTFAEPAIDALLTSGNCTNKPVQSILFQSPPDAPELLARVTFANGARILSLNPVLEGDRLERIMPFLAHEAIHCDRTDTKTEEVIATSFDTFLYLQLVAAEPDLAADATPASREFNLDAMAMINSGRRLPESIGILPSAGITRALPGTTATFGSFAEFVSSAYANVDTGISPHEAVADAYIARLAPLAHMPAQTGFDVKYMDELLGRAMSQPALAAAIQALGLEPLS
jgi:hypothetical protein